MSNFLKKAFDVKNNEFFLFGQWRAFLIKENKGPIHLRVNKLDLTHLP
jgi:hypothetical protein